jgi:hypothetical protein
MHVWAGLVQAKLAHYEDPALLTGPPSVLEELFGLHDGDDDAFLRVSEKAINQSTRDNSKSIVNRVSVRVTARPPVQLCVRPCGHITVCKQLRDCQHFPLLLSVITRVQMEHPRRRCVRFVSCVTLFCLVPLCAVVRFSLSPSRLHTYPDITRWCCRQRWETRLFSPLTNTPQPVERTAT